MISPSEFSDFAPTRDRIEELARQAPHDVIEHGFRTLVLNRTRRGGVLAPGAALTKYGENGQRSCVALVSRDAWEAPRRDFSLVQTASPSARLTGLRLLEDVALHRSDACFFVDPPYTAGGKRAGSRLYAHNTVDHAKLFELMAASRADFLMTLRLLRGNCFVGAAHTTVSTLRSLS